MAHTIHTGSLRVWKKAGQFHYWPVLCPARNSNRVIIRGVLLFPVHWLCPPLFLWLKLTSKNSFFFRRFTFQVSIVSCCLGFVKFYFCFLLEIRPFSLISAHACRTLRQYHISVATIGSYHKISQHHLFWLCKCMYRVCSGKTQSANRNSLILPLLILWK